MNSDGYDQWSRLYDPDNGDVPDSIHEFKVQSVESTQEDEASQGNHQGHMGGGLHVAHYHGLGQSKHSHNHPVIRVFLW